MNADRYHEIGASICQPYVDAFDPAAEVSAYLSDEPGMIAELDPDVTTCWDYADDAMRPPGQVT
jgi:hypothetical protein